MAKIKITEVGTLPRTPNTPNVEGATIPLGIATQFGKAVGSLGKVIEDIAIENKAEEDANEASDIFILAIMLYILHRLLLIIMKRHLLYFLLLQSYRL